MPKRPPSDDECDPEPQPLPYEPPEYDDPPAPVRSAEFLIERLPECLVDHIEDGRPIKRAALLITMVGTDGSRIYDVWTRDQWYEIVDQARGIIADS